VLAGCNTRTGRTVGGMRDAIVIELAGEPQGKGRPRFVALDRSRLYAAAPRSYETTLRLAAQEVMAGRIPIEWPI